VLARDSDLLTTACEKAKCERRRALYQILEWAGLAPKSSMNKSIGFLRLSFGALLFVIFASLYSSQAVYSPVVKRSASFRLSLVNICEIQTPAASGAPSVF
jgi:hypothetical protein